MRHTLTSRIVPLLVMGIIAVPVWYAATNRVSLTAAPQATAQPVTHTSPTEDNAQPLPALLPEVQQAHGQVTLSVDTKSYSHVQKVEFYLENQLVGAAYAQPYSVSLATNSLLKGTHQVTAKIYTDTAMAETQPVSFTSTSTAAAMTSTSSSATVDGDTDTTVPSASPGVNPASVPAPVNVAANDNGDGASATVSWDAVSGADSYQIWRDGTLLTTVQAVSYDDTGLTPGQTYDYQIVATSGSRSSDYSAIAAVTIATPPTDSSAQSTAITPASSEQAQDSSNQTQ